MPELSSAVLSKSISNMAEICLTWLAAFIIVTIVSYAVGVSNTPLIHARKRSEKLRSFVAKLIARYSSPKKPGISTSIIYFKRLRKLRAQARKSLQVYIYDDGRHQSEAESIAALFKGIDNCTNKAINALTNDEYDVLIRNLSVISKLADNAVRMLDELISKEEKERLLDFI